MNLIPDPSPAEGSPRWSGTPGQHRVVSFLCHVETLQNLPSAARTRRPSARKPCPWPRKNARPRPPPGRSTPTPNASTSSRKPLKRQVRPLWARRRGHGARAAPTAGCPPRTGTGTGHFKESRRPLLAATGPICRCRCLAAWRRPLPALVNSPVRRPCQVLAVPPSGFDARQHQPAADWPPSPSQLRAPGRGPGTPATVRPWPFRCCRAGGEAMELRQLRFRNDAALAGAPRAAFVCALH